VLRRTAAKTVVDVLVVVVTLLEVDVDVVVGSSEHCRSLHPKRHVGPSVDPTPASHVS
jgi:hypothetical protein